MEFQAIRFGIEGVERKNFEGVGEIGIFSGLASTFGNIDRDGDMVMKGAFRDCTDAGAVRLLWQHDQKEPLGVFREVRETDAGLEVKGELNLEVQRAREAYSLLKQGAIRDMSIGFKTTDSSPATVDDVEAKGGKRRIRQIKKVQLFEISLVTVPANPKARVRTVKSAGGDLPPPAEIEIILREAGLSIAEAKCVVAKGYRHLLAERGGNVDHGTREAGAGVGIDATAAEEIDRLIATISNTLKG